VDGRPVKISKDNMLNLIVEGLGIIFNGQSDQQTVTKVPTLNGNNFGASTVATLASVLGGLTVQGRILKTDNIDAITTTGLYGFNFASSGKPEGFPATLGTLCVINSVILGPISVPLVIHTIYDYVGAMYTRSCWDGTWRNWKEINMT
jgi:hypothetical protein